MGAGDLRRFAPEPTRDRRFGCAARLAPSAFRQLGRLAWTAASWPSGPDVRTFARSVNTCRCGWQPIKERLLSKPRNCSRRVGPVDAQLAVAGAKEPSAFDRCSRWRRTLSPVACRTRVPHAVGSDARAATGESVHRVTRLPAILNRGASAARRSAVLSRGYQAG
jgi:hypothetical protein